MLSFYFSWFWKESCLSFSQFDYFSQVVVQSKLIESKKLICRLIHESIRKIIGSCSSTPLMFSLVITVI